MREDVTGPLWGNSRRAGFMISWVVVGIVSPKTLLSGTIILGLYATFLSQVVKCDSPTLRLAWRVGCVILQV